MNARRTFNGLALSSLLGIALTACGTATSAHGSTPAHHVVPVSQGATSDSSPVVQRQTPAPVCAGIPACHVVATRDVNGDGRADQIGWRQVSKQAVQIRVRIAPHQVLTANVDVTLWWGGGAWGGASRVDNAPGSELLVGSMQGAHTPMYTMLTYRSGRLVVEKSPSPLSPLWQIDAADGDYMGWWRHTSASGHVTMTQKIAVRIGDGARFRGHDVTYTWAGGAWSRTASSTRTYATGNQASVIAGFHIAGIKKFPGIT